MRVVLQRVSQARVVVDDETVGEIGSGLLVLLGIQTGDTEDDARWLADKITSLRIFEDAEGKMNRSVKDIPLPPVDGSLAPTVLVVSQFTLIASTRKGARPSFNDAARPEVAIPLYESFLRLCETSLGRPVASGHFGAMMEVSLLNDGPVTLVIDSKLRE